MRSRGKRRSRPRGRRRNGYVMASTYRRCHVHGDNNLGPLPPQTPGGAVSRIRFAVALLLSLILPSTARATWSVIAVDMATGRVVIASATCVNRDDAFLMGIQAVVVPGKGVAACQAGVDGTHANQMLVYE